MFQTHSRRPKVDQDIARLEVAVHHVGGVQVLDPAHLIIEKHGERVKKILFGAM